MRVVPASSRNPELDQWLGKKPRMILLNKMDAADPQATDRWIQYYRRKGVTAFACDCRSGRNLQKFLPALREELAPLIERRNSRGMTGPCAARDGGGHSECWEIVLYQ